ncbi:MAG: hypothetical protein RLN89_04525 [Parvibaculum sp.]
MSGRPIFTLVAGFSALLGMTAISLATDATAPETTSAARHSAAPNEEILAAHEAPASILVEMRYSSVHRISQFADDAQTLLLPVYFSADAVEPSKEALLLLGAVADEAAVYAGVAITIKANALEGDASSGLGSGLGAARAMAVFNSLNELGVPARAMALDLDPNENMGPGASLISATSAI